MDVFRVKVNSVDDQERCCDIAAFVVCREVKRREAIYVARIRLEGRIFSQLRGHLGGYIRHGGVQQRFSVSPLLHAYINVRLI